MCSGQWDAVKSQSERFLGKDTQSWHCPPKLIKKKEYAEWLSPYIEPRTSAEGKEAWRKQHEWWRTSLQCCQTHLNTIPIQHYVLLHQSGRGWRGFPIGVRKPPRAKGQGIPSVLAQEMKQCIPNFHSKDKQEELVPKGDSPAWSLLRHLLKEKRRKYLMLIILQNEQCLMNQGQSTYCVWEAMLRRTTWSCFRLFRLSYFL